jgi:hypothetical protein
MAQLLFSRQLFFHLLFGFIFLFLPPLLLPLFQIARLLKVNLPLLLGPFDAILFLLLFQYLPLHLAVFAFLFLLDLQLPAFLGPYEAFLILRSFHFFLFILAQEPFLVLLLLQLAPVVGLLL